MDGLEFVVVAHAVSVIPPLLKTITQGEGFT